MTGVDTNTDLPHLRQASDDRNGVAVIAATTVSPLHLRTADTLSHPFPVTAPMAQTAAEAPFHQAIPTYPATAVTDPVAHASQTTALVATPVTLPTRGKDTRTTALIATALTAIGSATTEVATEATLPRTGVMAEHARGARNAGTLVT